MPENIKTLLITSCTGSKKYDDENELYAGDMLPSNFENRKRKEDAMRANDHYCSAYDMYVGSQYGPNDNGILGPVKCAIEYLRQNNYEFDHYILSAGYGLIPSNKEIYPYDISFNYPTSSSKKYTDIRAQTNFKDYKEWGNFLKIRNDFDRLIEKYDLIIILLANNYTKVLNLKKQKPLLKKNQKIIYIDNSNNLPTNVENFEIIEPKQFDDGRYEKSGSQFNFKCRGHIFCRLIKCAKQNEVSAFEYLIKSSKDDKINDLNNKN